MHTLQQNFSTSTLTGVLVYISYQMFVVDVDPLGLLLSRSTSVTEMSITKPCLDIQNRPSHWIGFLTHRPYTHHCLMVCHQDCPSPSWSIFQIFKICLNKIEKYFPTGGVTGNKTVQIMCMTTEERGRTEDTNWLTSDLTFNWSYLAWSWPNLPAVSQYITIHYPPDSPSISE